MLLQPLAARRARGRPRRAGAARGPGPLALAPRRAGGGPARWRRAPAPAAPYAIQAAIAAEHARAPRAIDTDWARIASLYERLEETAPLRGGRRSTARWRWPWRRAPRAGCGSSTSSTRAGELDDYHLLHSARGGLLRRLGRDAGGRCRLRARARAGDEPGRAPLSRAPASGARARERRSRAERLPAASRARSRICTRGRRPSASARRSRRAERFLSRTLRRLLGDDRRLRGDMPQEQLAPADPQRAARGDGARLAAAHVGHRAAPAQHSLASRHA